MRNTSLATVHNFPGVVAVGRITSRRRQRGQHADPPLVRHYLLSTYMSPKRFLQVTRSHWGIENRAHYVRDVTLGEENISLALYNNAVSFDQLLALGAA